MKKVLQTLAVLSLAVSLVACGKATAAVVVKSEKARITSPQVSQSDLQVLLEGNRDFALSLYDVLKDEKDGNVFYSPYSISLVMAMAFAGARGETARQMTDAMEYDLSPDGLHAAFNHLSLQLAKRTSDAASFNLDIVNDVWGQKDYKFLDAYLDTMAQNYGAGLRVVDFMNDPGGARKTINDYVYDQTNKLIEDLIPEGSINNLTRMVLTNAIYFKAEWKSKFDKDATRDGAFKLLDGTKATVPMMNQRSFFEFARGEGWKAIELPYLGEQIAMDIVLPDSFRAFEASVDADKIDEILAAMDSRDIQLSMPRFKFASDFDLKDALSTLGMAIAFDPQRADFSGISSVEDLYIQDVVHKALVAVDEAGTEAAAASAVTVGTVSMAEPMVVDSPFIFLIRDLQSGTILFMGRVLNPALQ